MLRYPISIGIIFIFIICNFSGCIEKEEISINERDKFIGTWKIDGHSGTTICIIEILNFFSDGYFTADCPNYGTFNVTEGKLVLNIMRYVESVEYYNYKFSNNNKVLELIDSNTHNMTFEKILGE